MAIEEPPRWLEWAQEIQALAQTGAHYAENGYQRERNLRLMEIAAQIAHAGAGFEYNGILAAYNDQLGYATPKVDVRGAVFREGKLLLVRERQDGRWTLPGGWADVGDLPSAAAEREVWEEAGFKVRASKVIGVYDANRLPPLELFHAFKIIFLCELLSGQPTPSSETSEVAFFGPQELPVSLSGERTRPRHIQDAFRLLAEPDYPTVFD
jgi:ADP-ribose pyrophosphatase YjhB (NUDIX family)